MQPWRARALGAGSRRGLGPGLWGAARPADPPAGCAWHPCRRRFPWAAPVRSVPGAAPCHPRWPRANPRQPLRGRAPAKKGGLGAPGLVPGRRAGQAGARAAGSWGGWPGLGFAAARPAASRPGGSAGRGPRALGAPRTLASAQVGAARDARRAREAPDGPPRRLRTECACRVKPPPPCQGAVGAGASPGTGGRRTRPRGTPGQRPAAARRALHLDNQPGSSGVRVVVARGCAGGSPRAAGLVRGGDTMGDT